MSTSIEGTEVRLGRDPDDYRKYVITVAVHSAQRPSLKASVDVDPGKYPSVTALTEFLGISAGGCAEYLGRYGDNIDPDAACRNAVKAFGEECRLLAELAKDVPAKIKRLEQHKYLLNNEQVEMLRRMRYLVDHSERLLPIEVKWLNDRLAPIHGGQL
jgi:hypothetical protein